MALTFTKLSRPRPPVAALENGPPRIAGVAAGGRDLLAVGLALALLLAAAGSSLAYVADANTGPDAEHLETRLFADAAQSVAPPLESPLWFVADRNHDGVPTAPIAGSILGADDLLILADTVKGSALVGIAGQYQHQAIEVPDACAGANIIVYLWDVAADTPVGQAGQTFGLADLGVVPVPDVGNAAWVINAPIHSDQFTVLDSTTTAPEPSVLLLLLSGGAVVHLARRTRPRGLHPR